MSAASHASEAPGTSRWRRYLVQLIGAEISALTRYFDACIQYEPLPQDDGLLLETIDCPSKRRLACGEALPDLSGETSARSAVLMDGNFNHSLDIQALLSTLRPRMARTTRLLVVAYNPYYRWLYAIATRLGLRRGPLPTTYVTTTDVHNLLTITGFKLVRMRRVGYLPFRLFGLGTLVNTVLPAIPLLRHLSLSALIVIAPAGPDPSRPSLSVVIPARNERGNIERGMRELAAVAEALHLVEVVFVEGHSTDGTWEEIERVAALPQPFRVACLRQVGVGKADAARLGLAATSGELVTILDADLTMPPASLPRFYEAYRQGQADFINGSRLVYPMEGDAMRGLNWLGNVAFAKALSVVLEVRLGDSLCGTKLFARHDLARLVGWRRDFGEFDPFGDFELLFPSAMLALGIVDVPVRYGARTYGSTNIQRFRHGLMLARMTWMGLWRVRTGTTGRTRVGGNDAGAEHTA